MRQEKRADGVGMEADAELGFDLDDEPETDQDMDTEEEDGAGTTPDAEPEDGPYVDQDEAKKRIPRGDYLEFIRVAMFLCGYMSLLKMQNRLSATHHARWMGSCIYIFKMLVCIGQPGFDLNPQDQIHVVKLAYYIIYIHCLY